MTVSKLIGILYLAVAGCGPCVDCTREPTGATDPVQRLAPGDFRLQMGKGGGFSGQWQGVTVLGTGAVWRWSGFGGPTDSTLFGVLEPADVDSIWADVLASGLFDRSTDGSGNLSARIEVTGDSRGRTLSWASGLALDAPTITEEQFYRRVERLLLDRLADDRMP